MAGSITRERTPSRPDRWRQNLLILHGWCVLRFTWAMIEEHPEKVIAMVREAIDMLTAARA
jgi:very-short-patch-repair endonuclease